MWKIKGIENLLIRLRVREERIGLALSGGGVRGFCHIGVLKAFEQFGVIPDILSGVSAGSIAASLYGAGLTPDEILECFNGATKFGHYTDFAVPKRSLFKMDKFARMLESWLPVRNLEEMKIPTIICATDFENGKSVGWAKGEIVPRVIASCSIPVVFPPVEINGIKYVDGGVLRNLPAWAIRKYSTTLYGSNCSPLNRKVTPGDSLIDTAWRSFQLMSKANTLQDINLCDHIIQPIELGQYNTFDLTRMKAAVDIGYDTACRVLEESLK